jgi:hypothetical protein
MAGKLIDEREPAALEVALADAPAATGCWAAEPPGTMNGF